MPARLSLRLNLAFCEVKLLRTKTVVKIRPRRRRFVGILPAEPDCNVPDVSGGNV